MKPLFFLLAMPALLLAETHVVSKIGSERATSGSGAKIATFDGKTHVVWQDRADDDGYLNLVRSFVHASGEWTEPFTLNRDKSNHARPVITVDEEGYLHAVLSGHNSAVTYRRSLQPNNASAWSESETLGKVTYPAIACGVGGRLIVTMRSGPRWRGVDCYTKDPGQPWSDARKIFDRDPKYPGYAGYQTGLAWGPDGKTLHFVADFYESARAHPLRGIHQAVCYLRSPDQGETWQKADGSPVETPCRPEQMDILARSTGNRRQPKPPPWILAQGSIVCDASGTPHVLYISHLEEPGQVIIASPDAEGKWQQRAINAIEQAEPNFRPTGCRGAWSIGSDGSLHALLELHSLDQHWTEDGKPTRPLMFATEGKKMVWLRSKNGESWSVTTALPEGQVFQQNLERPTRFNQVGPNPVFLFFDGESRYPEGEEILQNSVFLVR
ncbi:MAG: BNR-4 repeat-containing protein [Verrucomicrobiota bacterium]